MKETSSSRFVYSEAVMADAFQKLLRSSKGLPGIGAFESVYREINCRQGRPDFIALRRKNTSSRVCFPSSIGLVGASIMSLLKPRAPRTFNFLKTHSEFSPNSIKKSLRLLLSSGHVEQTVTESYILGAIAKEIAFDIWAFELKLDNPKRAIFQAQQYRSFAEQSIIVVPPGQEKNYERYKNTMKRWGIGLVTFDPITRHFAITKRTRKAPAFSKLHQIYALSQIFTS